jgi:hypothetical protein
MMTREDVRRLALDGKDRLGLTWGESSRCPRRPRQN